MLGQSTWPGRHPNQGGDHTEEGTMQEKRKPCHLPAYVVNEETAILRTKRKSKVREFDR
jgi:hypothetical protein